MLYELNVENIALIRDMRLTLFDGMNALTGETGAGKSLIIDALSLLLGARSNDALIRSGAERAVVEGLFMPPYPAQLSALAGADVDLEDNLILRRELIRGGRSVVRINGRVSTLSHLREIGRLLVNIHGQNEHTLLLEESQQLSLLDSFGGTACLTGRKNVAQAFSQLKQAEQQMHAYNEEQDERAYRIESLHMVIEEITAAAPKIGEDETLREEARLLAHGEKLYQLTRAAYDALNEGAGAVERLNEAASVLKKALGMDSRLHELAQRLDSLYFEAEDVAEELSAYQDRINLDVYRQEETEARLALLGRLCKKYGGSIDAVLQRLTEAKEECQHLEDISASGDLFREQLQQAQRQYDSYAESLHVARVAAATRLGEVITEQIKEMAMPNAVFRVELTDSPASAVGTERVQFMICTNTGEAFLPVNKIASGGELSRIMLGVRVVLSQLDAVPTLVFDEIDTGMSGRALVAVARRVALVSRTAQTISISHSAVMAAAADHQILIEKHEQDGRTIVVAQVLSDSDRPAELARMIAGDQLGETTLKQAQELIESMHAPQE